MAKVFEKDKDFKNPQIETDMVICTQSLETGLFTINIDKYCISLTKEEKEALVAEWSLMENGNDNWIKAGNPREQNEKWLNYMNALHNPTERN